MISVGALTEAECEAAGALVAARHARERERFPLLPSAYEDPAPAADLVRRTLPLCDCVAARDDDGALVGFLTSYESVPDPTSPMARYLPARSTLHPVHGHAVAAQVDAFRTYAALFGAVAARALERGVIDHVVHVPIGDHTVEAAWAALGFGRANVVAVRDLAPIGRPSPSEVDVRVAAPEELDIVDALIDEEPLFHAASPMFLPYRRDATREAVRAELASDLASDDHAFLIARRTGRDVGVISIAPGRGSPLYVPDGAAYLAATAVLPDERGSGAGTVLVAAALAWATDHGHVAACLHYSAANVTSATFWTGIGFTPVMTHMRRRLDDDLVNGVRPMTAHSS